MEKQIWLYFSMGTGNRTSFAESRVLSAQNVTSTDAKQVDISLLHWKRSQPTCGYIIDYCLKGLMCVQKKTLTKVTSLFYLVCFRVSAWSYSTTLSHTLRCILLSMTGRQALVFIWRLNPKARKTVRTWHDCYCQTDPLICMGSPHYLWQIAIGKDLVLSFSLDRYL